MPSLINKLRGRSLGELFTRSRQLLQSRAENYGLGISLPKKNSLTSSNGLSLFFAPWRNDPDGFKHIFKARFSEATENVINRADNICRGKFEFLGFDALEFGADIPDWHFDPISKKNSPKIHWTHINEVSSAETGDKKIIWELNRHQYFTMLGQAYLLTENEIYAETFDRHLSDWFENNPPKLGVNWLSSLELAFRSLSWIESFYFFESSPSFRPETKENMARFLYLQAEHIEKYLSTYFSPNTHLTGEALGLYVIGSFLDSDKNTERWKNKGSKILNDALSFQIRNDGVYCEQSSHYCRYTADIYLYYFRLEQFQGNKNDAGSVKKIEALCNFLMHITEPNGETPLFGDDDGGKLFQYDDRQLSDMRATLELAALFFDRQDLKLVAADASPQLLMLTGLNGLERYDQIEAKQPAETAKAYKDSGYFVARSSWETDADLLLIDCGPHGFMNGGHAHSDALAFTLDLGGKPIFVDSGTYVYTSDLNARDLFRSSASHNSVTVNGLSSSITDGPFSWKSMANASLLEWQSEDEKITFVGTHDGFESLGVKYERSITYEKGGNVEIRDFFKCNSKNEIAVNFILSPTIVPVISEDLVYLKDLNSGKAAAKIRSESLTADGAWTIVDHNISTAYGKLVSTKKLVFSATTDKDTVIIFKIAPIKP